MLNVTSHNANKQRHDSLDNAFCGVVVSTQVTAFVNQRRFRFVRGLGGSHELKVLKHNDGKHLCAHTASRVRGWCVLHWEREINRVRLRYKT